MGIPAKYREWRRLLNPFRREKCGLPLLEDIRRIKGEVFARPIATVEPAASEDRRKRSSLPAREPSVEQRSKISSASHEGSSTAMRLVIDLTSSNGKK